MKQFVKQCGQIAHSLMLIIAGGSIVALLMAAHIHNVEQRNMDVAFKPIKIGGR